MAFIFISVLNAIDKADPIDKAKGFFDDRNSKKERCAERADSASTSYAAKKIYKACMGRQKTMKKKKKSKTTLVLPPKPPPTASVLERKEKLSK